jgi:hypothetical protein
MARSRIDDNNDDLGFSEADDINEDVCTLAHNAAERASTQEDAPEARSITSRCRIREQLEKDLQAYLSHGGAIHHVEQVGVTLISSHHQDNDYGYSLF